MYLGSVASHYFHVYHSSPIHNHLQTRPLLRPPNLSLLLLNTYTQSILHKLPEKCKPHTVILPWFTLGTIQSSCGLRVPVPKCHKLIWFTSFSWSLQSHLRCCLLSGKQSLRVWHSLQFTQCLLEGHIKGLFLISHLKKHHHCYFTLVFFQRTVSDT